MYIIYNFRIKFQDSSKQYEDIKINMGMDKLLRLINCVAKT